MNLCSTFQLNVLRSSVDCTFLLNWGEGQQLDAHLKYPPELDGLYQNWQSCYEKAYKTPLRARIEDDIPITPRSTDWKNQAEEAKEKLLRKFQQWLGDSELGEIRQQIRNQVEQKPPQKSNNCVNLLIASNCRELDRLPWEAWQIAPENTSTAAIYISRTVLNTGNKPIAPKNTQRRGKARILAILADSPELDLHQDRKALRSLSKVAEVEILKFEPGDIKQQFIQHLLDQRGWEALIFSGHSAQTTHTGGKLELAPNVTLSISEIEYQLTQAKNLGLGVAIFNSCNGLDIASSLIRLGFTQVVVMREKIHDEVAHIFLQQLSEKLANYTDLQAAIAEIGQYFQSQKVTYPSAYLIPSLFRHPSPQAEIFQLEPIGLKRFWRDWKPSRWEAIALSTTLLLSSLVPVQDFLWEFRYLAQAIYRHPPSRLVPTIGLTKTDSIPGVPSPPVRLIIIDQDSIYKADATIPEFKAQPIDRKYLAQLVTKLSQYQARVIGIDYLLDTKEDQNKEKELANAIKNSVQNNKTWFIFAADTNYRLLPDIFNPLWSLQGDSKFLFWDVSLPRKLNYSELCPFVYWLTLAQRFSQHQSASTPPQPNVQSTKGLQSEIINYLKRPESHNQKIPSESLPFGLRLIMDFSIPPKQVYEYDTAADFLSKSLSAENKKRLQQQVVIISPGVYLEVKDDTFSMPLAINYWCQPPDREKCLSKFQEKFIEGEAFAYQIHHLLYQHRVIAIPDIWMVGLAIILGKGTTLILYQQKLKQRQKWAWWLGGLTAIYGIVGLQVYILPLVSIPLFLPSCLFWIYILPCFRSQIHA